MKLTIKNRFEYTSYIASCLLLKNNNKEYSMYDNHENTILELSYATGTIYDYQKNEEIIFTEKSGILFLEHNHAIIVFF